MIKSFELLKNLEGSIVFNIAKVAAITGNNRKYTAVLVSRLVKQGKIIQLGRDMYTTKKDPFLIASHIYWPSYISLWAAIRYYNLTEQLPANIEVITPFRSRKKTIPFVNSKIIFTLTKPKYFFGFKKIEYENEAVFIAEKEKALIDGALFKKISFSELEEILQNNKKKINISRLINYAVKTQNKTLLKRFGFLAEELGYDFYKRLKKHIEGPHSKLDYFLPPQGKTNEKWHIIDNRVST